MIDIVNCTHHYGIRPVLRDINLHINAGELTALMGPNGMGKSTLLGIMAGILWPARGYVEIDGKRRRRTMEEEAAIRRMTIYLPDDAWMSSFLSGREWILAVGRMYGHESLHLMDHADRLLALFDLTEIQDKRVSDYSAGQRKKIALASALISEAPVMLLDEPFSGGLDPAGILALKRVLQGLRDRRKCTIVFATPVPELVEDLADRVALIRDGTITAFDTLDGLRKQANCTGGMAEIYEKLVSPTSGAKVEQYFQEGVR